jgi:hypothetical protein
MCPHLIYPRARRLTARTVPPPAQWLLTRSKDGRHFRALAAAEDSTWNVHFRATPRMPGLRYLRRTDLPNVDDSSAVAKSYQKGGLT